jgi:hypothetical protein
MQKRARDRQHGIYKMRYVPLDELDGHKNHGNEENWDPTQIR